MNNFGLYIIMTQPVLPYTRIAEICVKHKIKYLQLREKHFSDKVLLQLAKDIQSICIHSETQFIVNDHVSIAILSEADGVHLGQDDLSKNDAEKILTRKKVIGLSTHNLLQAETALAEKPDYIGFGPLYTTPTKANPDPVTGLSPIKEILKMSEKADIPVVGIGGIDETNICHVLDAGIKNLALVRYFMNTSDFENRLVKMQHLIQNYH
ncbi:MAG: thiamine phosphate synthase [Candidatus Cloacimonetes bacterium]|nr:thiamine phosphate synthase [Candidatus Cloacimonadota bacterium]